MGWACGCVVTAQPAQVALCSGVTVQVCACTCGTMSAGMAERVPGCGGVTAGLCASVYTCADQHQGVYMGACVWLRGVRVCMWEHTHLAHTSGTHVLHPGCIPFFSLSVRAEG